MSWHFATYRIAPIYRVKLHLTAWQNTFNQLLDKDNYASSCNKKFTIF